MVLSGFWGMQAIRGNCDRRGFLVAWFIFGRWGACQNQADCQSRIRGGQAAGQGLF